jgi:glycerophosphoryl diester phosphodiesterase
VPARLPSLRRPPVGFAHRGARAHARENTLEAFALALRLGAVGLESDVWLTADGQAVLDHDGRVGGRLRRTPLRAVAAADLPAHVPTLAQLYEACGTGFELSLDVKDADALGEVLTVARAAGGGAEERLWLCHGHLPTVASWRARSTVAKLVHSSRLGALGGSPEAHAARMADAGVDALNLRHTEWTGGRTTLLHRFERLALAWDCQHARTLDEVLDAGIDGVYSDHVDRMVDAIERLGGHGR